MSSSCAELIVDSLNILLPDYWIVLWTKKDFATSNPLLIQDLISEPDYKILPNKVS